MRTEKTSTIFSPDLWAFIICLLGFSLWSCLLFFKFRLFGFYDWDLALYAQTMQSLCHGTTYASLFQTSFLADHTHCIAFLLTPIYALFPHPLTLINLELIGFFAGGYIFYKIASKTIGQAAALVLMLIYLFHPANVFMLFYEFHFESLATGFIFLMFYCWSEKKWVPFIITAFILMMIKENMALIVVMFGIYGLLFNKENKWMWGGIVFTVGVVYFVVNMFVLIPYVRQGMLHTSNNYWTCYSQFGSSPQAILQYAFFHPIAVLKVVCTPDTFQYFVNCTGPFLFLSVFGPRFLIGLPILAQNLLSNTNSMHTIYYHYAATLIPFAAMGALDVLGFIKTHVRSGVFMILIGLMIYSAGISEVRYWPAWEAKINDWADPSYAVRQSMIDEIPKGASVVTSFCFLSHLTDHKDLYAFYNVWRGINYFTRQEPFRLPQSVQYALIDYNDPWLIVDLGDHPKEVRSRINNFFMQNTWIVKRRYGKIVLYEKYSKTN
jgi:uncharacterized membrane protein